MPVGFSAPHPISTKPLRVESVPGDVPQRYRLGAGSQPASVTAEMFEAGLGHLTLLACHISFSKSHQDNLSAEMPRVKAYLGVFIP